MILNWLKKNLFSNWFNTFLTLISLGMIYWLGSSFLKWAISDAAQWTVITANLKLFWVGFYPSDQLWRPWSTLIIIISVLGLSWGILEEKMPLLSKTNLFIVGNLAAVIIILSFTVGFISRLILFITIILLILLAYSGKALKRKGFIFGKWLPFIWLLTFISCLWLLLGWGILKPIQIDQLSGLILTLLVASVSIVLSFPFGILLALGRQSDLPVIRWLSIAYIEIIRGLPLIGILFMAQVMLPLILPINARPDRVIRAIAGFTIFASAYLAENIRGGLQSIPRGQTEAAKALGLNPVFILGLVILPQAIRVVIPSIVGQFISLFKDTSLLAIVGLVDLLGISQSILANPKYIGQYAEVYLFIAAIYWCFCSAMSQFSRRLEQ
ncbi:MAG: amino acid ABC transporter permease [Microcystaceae cyanobacterium]